MMKLRYKEVMESIYDYNPKLKDRILELLDIKDNSIYKKTHARYSWAAMIEKIIVSLVIGYLLAVLNLSM